MSVVMNDYRVTVVLTTGISARTVAAAEQAVLRLLPESVEFGPKGAVLPFEMGNPRAKKIDWDKEPRP
jgi:hypothetical protein